MTKKKVILLDGTTKEATIEKIKTKVYKIYLKTWKETIYVAENEKLSFKFTNVGSIYPKKNRGCYCIKYMQDFKISYKSFGKMSMEESRKKCEEYREKLELEPGYQQKGDIVELTVIEYLALIPEIQNSLYFYTQSVDFPERDVEIPPYLLGVWLGDGASTTTKITNIDQPILDYLKEYCDENKLKFSKVGNSKYCYGMNGSGKKRGNTFRNGLNYYDLLNNKHIPDEYLYNSTDVRISVLAGFLDTDGSLAKNNYYDISQKSSKNTEGIIFLARSLGFCISNNPNSTGTCQKENGEKVSNIYNRMSISGRDICNIPVLILRKMAHPAEKDIDFLLCRPKITYVGEQEIEVVKLGTRQKYFDDKFHVRVSYDDKIRIKKPTKKVKCDSDNEEVDETISDKPKKRVVNKDDYGMEADLEIIKGFNSKKPIKKVIKKVESDSADEESDKIPSEKPIKKSIKKIESQSADEESDKIPSKKPIKKSIKKIESESADEESNSNNDTNKISKILCPSGEFKIPTYKKIKTVAYKITQTGGDEYILGENDKLHLTFRSYETVSENSKKKSFVFNYMYDFKLCQKILKAKNKQDANIEADTIREKLIKDSKYQYVGYTFELTVKDYFDTNKITKSIQKIMRTYKIPVEFQKIEKKLLDPYIIGMWLSAGSIDGRYITIPDSNVLAYFKKFCEKNNLTFVKVKGNDRYTIEEDDNILHRTLLKYDLIKKSSDDDTGRYIPHDYLYNNRETRMKLLAGIIDSKGNYGNSYKLTSTSDKMLEDIQFLTKSLGFKTSLQVSKNTSTNKDGTKVTKDRNRINVSGQNLLDIPLLITEKKAKPSVKDDSSLIVPFKIEKLGTKTIDRICLDGSDTYLGDDFTVRSCINTEVIPEVKPKKKKKMEVIDI